MSVKSISYVIRCTERNADWRLIINYDQIWQIKHRGRKKKLHKERAKVASGRGAAQRKIAGEVIKTDPLRSATGSWTPRSMFSSVFL